jgi:SAM-dependent methyltransferase
MEEGSVRPWSGEVLTLGRQQTSVTCADFRALANEVCFPVAQSRLPTGPDAPLSDQQLFRGLGFDQIAALDASAHEGADILHDLNNSDVPPNCSARFDVVFDGGTMEHVFDIAAVLRGICRMTRTGGRVIHISPMSNCVDHGFYSFSPTLFADFYAANNWLIRRLSIARFEADASADAWSFHDYVPDEFSRLGALEPGAYFVLACVQATDKSTATVVPQQSYYRKIWRR